MAGEVRVIDMSELFESIMRGMEDAIAHSTGEKTEVRLWSQKKNMKSRVCE